MKFLGVSWSRTRLVLAALSMIAVMVALLGWEPPPWEGQVRVCRSAYTRAKIPFESGMRVKDAVAMSRAVLGGSEGDTVVLYHWKPWLPERVPDATVMGFQGLLAFAGMHQWSDALWQWWDGILPRSNPWREVGRDGNVREELVHPGEMIVLRRER
jgi:hypothetical protein